MNKNFDLFETPQNIPTRVLTILNEYETGDELTYSQCEEMQKRCEHEGYTFEFYLDAVPFNLKPITRK